MKPKSSFGEFIKQKRIEKKLTLREFCKKYNLNPGYISKMERGLLSPPRSKDKLEKYASYLDIEKGTEDYVEFFYRASACRGEIPSEIMSDSELVDKLPLIFRTLQGKKVSPELLDDLVTLIRES